MSDTPCCDHRELQQEIRQLREKLEYSHLQNSLLISECSRLRRELQEAEFRGRSTIKSPCAPSLPDEVLRHIFSLATSFDGFAFPHWTSTAEVEWGISSIARRAIPLVCRNWHIAGLEFLYKHLAFRTAAQIGQLLDVLKGATPTIREQRMGWVRGLEFSVQHEALEDLCALNYFACSLIGLLPLRRLQTFGIDCGECDQHRSRFVFSIAAQLLERNPDQLKSLHLPCTSSIQDPLFNNGDLTPFTHSILPTTLPPVQTLSFTGGVWNSCDGTSSGTHDPNSLSALKAIFKSLHTILVNCSRFSDMHEVQFISCLEGASNVDTVHIVGSDWNSMITRRLDTFLENLPGLKRLLITPSARFNSFLGVDDAEDDFVHLSLEEITLYMDTSASYRSICTLLPLTNKIKSGNLPRLKRITIHGDFPEGCLDAAQVFSRADYELWLAAIECCAQQTVAMVSQDGHCLHLWSARHDIRLQGSEDDGTSSCDDDDEWFERSDDSNFWSSETTEDVISDDSGDGIYRYARRPDIEQVETDSDEEGEL